MDYSEEGGKQSKYNAALSQIYRLDSIWQRCQYYRRLGQLGRWNIELDICWSELSPDAKTSEIKKFNEFMIKIIKFRKSKGVLNYLLMSKEIFLRKLQDRLGKGTSYIDPDEDMLEEL